MRKRGVRWRCCGAARVRTRTHQLARNHPMLRVILKPDRGTHTSVTTRDTMRARKAIHRMGLLAGPPGWPPMYVGFPLFTQRRSMGRPMPPTMLNMGPANAPAIAICAKPSRAMDTEAAKSLTELLQRRGGGGSRRVRVSGGGVGWGYTLWRAGGKGRHAPHGEHRQPHHNVGDLQHLAKREHGAHQLVCDEEQPHERHDERGE